MKEGLDADTKFLLELRETCAAQDTEYAARTKARQDEITAVGEALKVLADDDNKDLASRTLGDQRPAAFVQLRASQRGARARAAAVLARAGKSGAKLAALARKGKFPKVIAAINEMVVGLKKEQQEEVEHKDFCNDKFHELEMTTMKKTEEQSGLEAKIADTTNHLEADKEKIVQINAEIADTTVAIQSANADRVKESQDFQTVVADQRAVQQVMLLALDKLEKFYGKSFLQTAPAKTEANATKGTKHVLTAHAARPSESRMAAKWHKSWGTKLADHAKAAEGAVSPTVAVSSGRDEKGRMRSLGATSALVQGRTQPKAQVGPVQDLAATKALMQGRALPKAQVVQDLEVKKALMQGSQTPPGAFKPYKKHSGSGAVLAMLKGLIKEAQRIEADAIAEENSAVQEYSRFIDDSQASREALFVELLSAQERTAEAEVQISEDKKSVDLLTDDLADLSSETAATHEACDFVLKNFDVRQTARAQEIEALGQAKAILSGAK